MYSDDLRGKVLAAYDAGEGTLREMAERFEVSYGWVLKISAQRHRSGSHQRVPQRQRGSALDTGLIRRLVEAQPDIVLVELQQRAAEQGVRASTVHLWRILRKLGLRLKKVAPRHRARHRSGLPQARSQSSGHRRDRARCARRPDPSIQCLAKQTLDALAFRVGER